MQSQSNGLFVQLTHPPYIARGPRWSSDGLSIAASIGMREGMSEDGVGMQRCVIEGPFEPDPKLRTL